jgi:hypothetical protein
MIKGKHWMPVLDETFKLRPKYKWYTKILRHIFKIRRNRLLPLNPVSDKDILGKMESEGRLVIQVPYGGLGDHLVYSALPELLWKQKNIKVFISTESIYRNKQIWDFVWGLNPFVKMTDEKGWFIHQPLDIIRQCTTINQYLIQLFNLDGDDAPKLYYQPAAIPELAGQAIVDCSCGPSGKANGYFDPEFYEAYLSYLEKNVPTFVLLTYQNMTINNQLQNKIVERFAPRVYSIHSPQELSDALFSASRRYLLYSGSASVAAAYNLPSIVLCNWKSSPHFQYHMNQYVDIVDHGRKCKRSG